MLFFRVRCARVGVRKGGLFRAVAGLDVKKGRRHGVLMTAQICYHLRGFGGDAEALAEFFRTGGKESKYATSMCF